MPTSSPYCITAILALQSIPLRTLKTVLNAALVRHVTVP